VVIVSLTRSGDRARLTVDDQGPGISVADRARVWEPFVRLARDPAQPGSGLGLTVVRDLARSLGGSASVDDAPSGGARFVIDLPLARGAATGGTAAASTAVSGYGPSEAVAEAGTP
jgi:signal transduction histidine kinase